MIIIKSVRAGTSRFSLINHVITKIAFSNTLINKAQLAQADSIQQKLEKSGDKIPIEIISSLVAAKEWLETAQKQYEGFLEEQKQLHERISEIAQSQDRDENLEKSLMQKKQAAEKTERSG